MATINDIPDLTINVIVSYLAWPEAGAALVVAQRFFVNAKAVGMLRSIINEQRVASFLDDEDKFPRARAQLPPTAKSTIALAFSCDRHTLASTHGDHTVKIVDVISSKVLATLEGHPRTPWTVKAHPFLPDIVASGCLGGVLKIWNSKTGANLFSARLTHPVISLSFHPDGTKLAAAAAGNLFLWEFEKGTEPTIILQTKVSLRCVRFLDENRVLVGIRSQTRSPAGLTSYIRAARAQLLMFRLDTATFRERRLLTDPVVVVKRALLYNDAGLDVTADNFSVLTCAEFLVRPRISPPPSPCTPDHFSVNDTTETSAMDLDLDERAGDSVERVAHLVQVSLHDEPRESSATSLPTTESTAALDGPGPGPRHVSCGGIMKKTCLDGLWGGVRGGTFVTSVKLSPTGEFVLLGCSRGNSDENETDPPISMEEQHPVAAVWRLGDMRRMETLKSDASDEDDANVALFHPFPGAGVVYGTKQGHIAYALSSDPAVLPGPIAPDWRLDDNREDIGSISRSISAQANEPQEPPATRRVPGSSQPELLASRAASRFQFAPR